MMDDDGELITIEEEIEVEVLEEDVDDDPLLEEHQAEEEEEIYEYFSPHEGETEIPDTPNSSNSRNFQKRKRVSNPELWKANLRKKLRNSGQEYVTDKGVVVRARAVQPKDCSKCMKKCNQKFTEEEREKIHKSFWGLADHEKQKIFISGLVEEAPPSRVRVKDKPSRRSVTRHYFLRNGKKRQQVCFGFFLATLDVTEAMVKFTVTNRDETTNFPLKNRRGLHSNRNTRPEEAKEKIREHIRSFFLPKPEEPDGAAKRRRKGGQEEEVQTVAAGMNIKRMWEDYVVQCQWEGVVPEKEWFYRQLVRTEFNIQFLDPFMKRQDDAPPAVFHEIIETSFEDGQGREVVEEEEDEEEQEQELLEEGAGELVEYGDAVYEIRKN